MARQTRKKISGDWRVLRCWCGGGWKRSAGETWKQMKRYYNWYKKKRSLMDLIWKRKKKLDRPYTQRWKPAKRGDSRSDGRKNTKGKKTIRYAKWVSERSVVCGTKEKGGKQERMENMEAKNLPNGRTPTKKWVNDKRMLSYDIFGIRIVKCYTQ